MASTFQLKAASILGDSYGGPSLSYIKEAKTFVVYSWGDAPVNTEILGSGPTPLKALEDFEEKCKTKCSKCRKSHHPKFTNQCSARRR